MPNENKMFSNVLASETLARCFKILSRNLQGKRSRAGGNILNIFQCLFL